MRKKRCWYGTEVSRDSGIYWVDFHFYWFRYILNHVVKKVVFKKRLRVPKWWIKDKKTCHGYWDEFMRTIYLNPATKGKEGRYHPLARTLLHELCHILDPAASEAYVRDDLEDELWELATEAQRAYLRRCLRKQWVRQYGKPKGRKSRRGHSRLLFFLSCSTIIV